jgi:predicted phosphatase
MKQWVEARRTIAVDWNGVLDLYCGYKGPEYVYQPRAGALSFLHQLCVRGYKVIVFTAADVDMVKQWLTDNLMMQFVDEVTNTKPPAIVYLDDRAICFNGNFNDALQEIDDFKTFWECEGIQERL